LIQLLQDDRELLASGGALSPGQGLDQGVRGGVAFSQMGQGIADSGSGGKG
jgi:hypothetical protein